MQCCKCGCSATLNTLNWLLQDDAETRGCEASNASNAFDLSVFSGLCSPTLEPSQSFSVGLWQSPGIEFALHLAAFMLV